VTAPLLELTGVAVRQGGIPVLGPLDLAVAPGERVALLGANGAGKSTLLKAVIGLLPVASGTVRFAGDDVTALSPERRARLGIGYVPEGRRVFPGMTVRENLEVACHAPRVARSRRVEEAFALFPDLRTAAGTRAWQLSGGQQQMLAIGRALMTAPRLLLLDEPSLGLAPRLVAELLARLGEIAAGGTAILLAEQNVRAALGAADRGVVLRLGRISARGTAAELSRAPGLADAVLGGH
jgi:branched-chain amino acid transport system ATP-binding protein